MTRYYSASTNGFYDDAVPAFAREIAVEDEDANRKALAELSARELEDDADIDAIIAARSALIRAPIMKRVPNPDCRLPEDAVVIEEEHYQAMMTAQSEGRIIVPNFDGSPTYEVFAISAEQALASARATRDRQLAATDWTQLPDALDTAKRKLWAAHRKYLRDLPARIEEAIGKGMAPVEAAELVIANIDATRPE